MQTVSLLISVISVLEVLSRSPFSENPFSDLPKIFCFYAFLDITLKLRCMSLTLKTYISLDSLTSLTAEKHSRKEGRKMQNILLTEVLDRQKIN